MTTLRERILEAFASAAAKGTERLSALQVSDRISPRPRLVEVERELIAMWEDHVLDESRVGLVSYVLSPPPYVPPPEQMTMGEG